ncbi:MAG: AAA family ATPase [Actinomycetota bacterium]
MRPLRLELSGFTAFREPVEVDFSDADYFAFVGPTGSGKSSLIDALTFALYGSVPRLDMRSVAPVISQGCAEARVRFDFAIGDRTFTAVRIVRRQGDGASTKEARLECGTDVLAGDAEGVTVEIGRLLGLGFEEFTRCVVLPQGDFARFMHDKPSVRQDLLVKLLDLDVYGRMLQRANLRAAEADAAAQIERKHIEELAYATEESLAEARGKMATVQALLERIDVEEPRLAGLRDAIRTGGERVREAERAAQALEKVRIPADVGRLTAAAATALGLAVDADGAVNAAEQTVKDADSALASLPARSSVETAIEAHRRRATLTKEVAEARKAIGKLQKQTDATTKVAEEAERANDTAASNLEAVKIQYRAHDLARTLVIGEPCPVCHKKVTTLPKEHIPADLKAAEKALEKATGALKAAREEQAATAQAAAGARATVEEREKQLAQLTDALAGHPGLETLEKDFATIGTAEKMLAGARKAAEAARAKARDARAVVEQAQKAEAAARKTLDAARDPVADLGPPPLSRDDLASDWEQFAGWAAQEATRRRLTAEEASAAVAAAEAEGRSIVEAQRSACEQAGIANVQSPRDGCITALAEAKMRAERIELALESVKETAERLRALEERAVVARELGKHLKANAFERWILRQALTTLVDGATDIMLELSGGQYSLTLDKQYNFAVIDHRSADAVRSARTLSGGETFLASLALALAMSDRIAQLSANTAVRLESIFLDEGFGSLDPETLETVAEAIEQLGRTSRVVGIVTHVRDLAERIPVRYEVRKGPTTSTVEKVFA